MQVFATLDGLHNLADVGAVLDDGVAHSHILQGNLVADRNVVKRFGSSGFSVGNPCQELAG